MKNASPVLRPSSARDPCMELPEPASLIQATSDGDTVIHVRRHGNPAGPRVVLSHGNGLAIDAYYPFWSLLLDDFDVLVFDLRSHGWNDRGSLRDHTIVSFVRDHDAVLKAIGERWGNKPVIGLYHSVACLAPLLSKELSTHYAGLVLFDPPIARRLKPTFQAFEEAITKAERGIRRRAHRFDSIEQFVELLGFVPMFRHLVSGGRELIARTTLRSVTDGAGYELRCPPEYEAQIAAYAGVLAVMVDYTTLERPVKVLGADPTMSFAYLPATHVSDFVTVDYDFLPETTHFLQLEQPDACRDVVIEFLRERNLV